VDARIKLRSSPELTARLEAAAKPVMTGWRRVN